MNASDTVKNVPTHAVALIRVKLDKAYEADKRHAAKAGRPVPEGPMLVVSAPRVVSNCGHCRQPLTGSMIVGWVSTCCGTPIRSVEVCDVTVACGRPTIGGWELIAVVEPQPADHAGNPSPNLIRMVPGSDIESERLTWHRQAGHGTNCDHCDVNRNRSETFLVASAFDGTLGKTIRQVGRSCLSAFLGGVAYEDIARRLAWYDACNEEEGGDEKGGWGFGGGHGPGPYTIGEVMSATACVVRNDGWRSKTAAMAGGTSTASQVSYLLDPPPRGSEARQEWLAEVKRLAPHPGDKERGVEAITWVREELDPRSEYEHSIRTLGMLAHVSRLGMVCSIYSAWARAKERDVSRRRAEAVPTAYYGAVGDKIGAKVGKGKKATIGPGLVGVVSRIKAIDGNYGTRTLIEVRGELPATALIVWWKTGAADDDLNVGDRVEIRGTIKAHTEYRGSMQTILTRCTIERLDVEPSITEDSAETFADCAGLPF